MKKNFHLGNLLYLTLTLLGALIIFYHSPDEYYSKDEIKKELTDKEAYQKFEDYNSSKNYYFKTTVLNKYVKSSIPFYYEKIEIKKNPNGYFSKNK